MGRNSNFLIRPGKMGSFSVLSASNFRLCIFLAFVSGFEFTHSISYPYSQKNITAIEQLTFDQEFSKDIASIMQEAALESTCDGNVFITTKGCADFMDYMLHQMSEWAPPVLLVTFQDFDKIGNSPVWATFLSWKKRPCSIVFVCDLMRAYLRDQMYSQMMGKEDEVMGNINLATPEENEIGHLKLPKFIESGDQVLYLTDYVSDLYNDVDVNEDGLEVPGSMNMTENVTVTINVTQEPKVQSFSNMNEIQGKILKQSGILMQILVENRSDTEPEALMHVYSVCEFCGSYSKWQQRDLGYWQRNKTQFGKFFHIFGDFHKLSFNHTNLNIGYFNHPPHFSCYSDQNSNQSLTVEDIEEDEVSALHEVPTRCEGVEWEMISQMGKSLDFTTTWINLSNPHPGQGYLGEASNISNMIASFEAERIDLAVGGISVTRRRIMYVDFSSVFANDPIVFVVEKKSDLFALGIWLAFNPEIWPLMFLLIAIISLLFHIIIYQYTLEPPKKTRGRWALSSYLHEESTKKPFHVAIFEALGITMQPLIGQPLSTSQITHRPRRLLKLLLIIWWFSCLIISTLYNTSLITSLINPISPKEPEQLQDLLDFGYMFKPAGKQGAFFELIKGVIDDIPDDESDQGIQEVTSKEEKKTVSLIKQISKRLDTDGSRGRLSSQVAYVIEESAVKGIKWDKKEIGFSQIKGSNLRLPEVIRERLFLTTYAWPIQRDAAFKTKIDTALGALNSAGLIIYWYNQFGRRDGGKEASSGAFKLREKLGQINLNMHVLQGAFIFLMFGHGFGALFFGVEHLTKRYKFRFFTRKEILNFCRRTIRGMRDLYVKYFASEHEDLQLRRRKNRMRFRGVVRTVTSFKGRKNSLHYLK